MIGPKGIANRGARMIDNLLARASFKTSLTSSKQMSSHSPFHSLSNNTASYHMICARKIVQTASNHSSSNTCLNYKRARIILSFASRRSFSSAPCPIRQLTASPQFVSAFAGLFHCHLDRLCSPRSSNSVTHLPNTGIILKPCPESPDSTTTDLSVPGT
jgi:hypothetical protein